MMNLAWVVPLFPLCSFLLLLLFGRKWGKASAYVGIAATFLSLLAAIAVLVGRLGGATHEVNWTWMTVFRIVCNQCMNICPTECIQLTGKKHPDPTKKGKVIDTYNINFEICILCDLCTEVCPTEAIVMTNNFELAEYSRDALYKDLTWLDENDTNVRRENKP